MLRLKDSTGVNWCEELPDNPDDPANSGGGLVDTFGLELMFKPL